MFSQISWATYIQTVVILIIIYYLFILYKYYRHDLSNILKKTQKSPLAEVAFTSGIQQSSTAKSNITNHADFMPTESQDKGYLALVRALTDEIQAFTIEAGNSEIEKEQILPSIQLLVSKYPSVKSSPYKQSIQELIAQQCATNCSVHFRDEELDGLWV